MSTTFTQSASSTFTATHAKYLASKIAADLHPLQLFYGGRPTNHEIEQYITEAVVLLLGGYLKDVTYGFRKNGVWLVALRYDARTGGGLADDRSGRVRPGVDIAGASWGSFLNYSGEYLSLSPSDRARIHDMLPFSRTLGEEPHANVRTSDKSYSNGGVGLQRQLITST